MDKFIVSLRVNYVTIKGNYKKHNFNGMHKKRLGLLLLVGLLVVVGFGLLPSVKGGAQADTTNPELRGWAWSSNIGWISFNSKDIAGSTSNYAVKLETKDSDNNEYLKDYAWSSNIGWINFDKDLRGPNNDGFGARISGDTLNGWARACSVFANGCSGGYKDGDINGPSLGGWDGWILLKDISVTTDVGGKTRRAKGYAWGALNVGWIDMGMTNEVKIDGGGGPTLTCEVSPTEGDLGTEFTWTANYSDDDVTAVYKWTGSDDELGSKEEKIVKVKYSSVGTGTKKGKVAVTMAGVTTGPVECSNNITKITNCTSDGVVPTAGKPCCSDCTPAGSPGEACPIACIPTECTFTISQSPGQIDLNLFGTGNYEYSPFGQSLTINPNNCSSGLNLVSSGFPTGSFMVCSVNGGEWQDNCLNLIGANIKVGVKAKTGDIDKTELVSGCKTITLTNKDKPSNSFNRRSVCFSGNIGN